jgi:hypothetical protein
MVSDGWQFCRILSLENRNADLPSFLEIISIKSDI